MDDREASKFLSYVLRHHPETVGIELLPNGWVAVDNLLSALAKNGRRLERADLERIVATSDKQRFAFSDDGSAIRANQGHSVSVDLGLVPLLPPDELFHGTVARFLDSIRAKGLLKGERHHVHLSAARDVAELVGSRRGRALILTVRASAMAAAGFQFLRSDNGVWLTEHVPPGFIDFPAG